MYIYICIIYKPCCHGVYIWGRPSEFLHWHHLPAGGRGARQASEVPPLSALWRRAMCRGDPTAGHCVVFFLASFCLGYMAVCLSKRSHPLRWEVKHENDFQPQDQLSMLMAAACFLAAALRRLQRRFHGDLGVPGSTCGGGLSKANDVQAPTLAPQCAEALPCFGGPFPRWEVTACDAFICSCVMLYMLDPLWHSAEPPHQLERPRTLLSTWRRRALTPLEQLTTQSEPWHTIQYLKLIYGKVPASHCPSARCRVRMRSMCPHGRPTSLWTWLRRAGPVWARKFRVLCGGTRCG